MRPPLGCTRPTAACIGDALAGSGFAHDADDVVAADIERDMVDDGQPAMRRGELHRRDRGFPAAALYFQSDQSPARRMRPTESRMPSPIRLKHSTVTEMTMPAAIVGTGDCAM